MGDLDLQTFTLSCNPSVGKFWSLYLPQMLYTKTGISMHELVDDAVSFYTYCFDTAPPFSCGRDALGFQRCAWNAMTRLYSLDKMLIEVTESLDDALRDIRIYTLYLEQANGLQGIPSLHEKERKPPYGIEKHFLEDPALEPFPNYSDLRKIKHLLFSHVDSEELREFVQDSPSRAWCDSAQVLEIQLSRATVRDFERVTAQFEISLPEAIRLALTQVRIFFTLSTSYSDSFREDLFMRRLNCRTLEHRWVELLSLAETTVFRTLDYCKTIAQRYSLISHGVPGGMTITEFFADHETLRDQGADLSDKVAMTDEDRRRAIRTLF